MNELRSWPYAVVESDVVAEIDVEMKPQSKQRPRFSSRGGVYTPKETREYENQVAALLKSSMSSKETDSNGSFGLRCVFYCADRQRRDCDNMFKAIADAATGIIWKDDSQVLEIHGKLKRSAEKNRVVALVHRVADSDPPAVCKVCGTRYRRSPSMNNQGYCSIACAGKGKLGPRALIACRNCGKEVEKSLARMKWIKSSSCSRACNLAYWGKRRNSGKGPLYWKCLTCGGPVSRKEYTRCNACRYASFPPDTSKGPDSGLRPATGLKTQKTGTVA